MLDNTSGQTRHNPGEVMREYNFGVRADLTPTVPPAELRKLIAAGQRQTYAKGEQLYRQGDRAERIYVLVSGTVKASAINVAGQETLLRIHFPGSLLGLTALGSNPRRDATAIALEPSETAVLHRDAVLAALHADPTAAPLLVRLLVDRLSEFHYRISQLAANSVEQRLAHVLLSLTRQEPAGAANGELAVYLTHEELSHIVNARRQTVTLAVNRFAEAGLVKQIKRKLMIVDPEGLARVVALGVQEP